MSSNRVLSIRNAVVATFVVSLLCLATFAFGERILPTVVVEMFTASATNVESESDPVTKAENSDTPVVVPKTAKRAFGTPNDGIVFGQGDLPLGFSRRFDRIYTIGPVGEPILLSGLNDFEPSWSPDGKKIVFVSLRGGPGAATDEARQDQRDIFTMNPDGSDQTLFHTPFYGGESQPSFSPPSVPDQKIIYVADYSSAGQLSGIYITDLYGNNSVRLNTDDCFPINERPSRSKAARSNIVGGYFPFDAPNYSPDGSHIIFGYNGYDEGYDIYRINPDGTQCSKLYSGTNSSYTLPGARYSRDGTQIALHHRDGNDGSHYLRIINSTTGAVIEDLQPENFMGSPVWSPDGAPQINYIGGDQNPDNEIGGLEIWTFNLLSLEDDPIYQNTIPYGIRGLDWGIPSTEVPPLTMRINEPHPLLAGTSTTGTVTRSTPAPVGGVTVNLQVYNPTGPGQTPILNLPSPTVFIPEGETQGTFQIDAPFRTDYRALDVYATSPSPNFGQAQATVSVTAALADLRALSISGPPSVAPGASFQISWSIDNIGQATTGTGWTDHIYFSADDQLDANDTLLPAFTNSPALAVGVTRTSNVTRAIPPSAAPTAGQYYLILRANPYEGYIQSNAINEGRRTANNTAVVPITIQLPDLVAENLVLPTLIVPGVNYPVSWATRNIGNIASGVSQSRLYYSPDATLDIANDIALDAVSNLALAPGATQTHATIFNLSTVPARADGTAYFYVRTDFTNVVYEGLPTGTGENNNTFSAETPFEYRVADLQVTATSVAADVDTDTSVPFSWTTRNAGNKIAGTFSERVYLSADNQVGSDTLLGTFALTGGLAAGASVDRIQNITVPYANIPASGNYYLYVQADSANAIDEGVNENNNTRFQSVYVRRALRPDLTVTNITGPATPFFDQTIQVQWTVTNSGSGPTNAPQWSDTIYIGTSPTSLSGATSLKTTQSISALNPGESYTASAIVKIPRGFNGAYYFLVKTDSGGDLNEVSTANNLRSSPVQIIVPPLPDLIVDSVQVPTNEAFAGSEMLVSYTIKNQGTARASAWVDRIYLSRDTTLNTSQDRLIYTTDGLGSGNGDLSLEAGASRTLTSRNKIPGTFNPYQFTTMRLPSDVQGLWYVFIVADVYDSVYEFTSENNNVNYDRVTPGSPLNILVTPPDLVVPNEPTAPATAASGTSFPVTFTVKNRGAFNAAPFLYHGVYLSTDQTFNVTSDALIGTFRDPDFFGPGVEHPITLNVNLPNCLANGTYYLFAVADYNNAQFEFDTMVDAEANNASPPRPIELSTVPPDLRVTSFVVPTINTPGQTVSVSWSVSNFGGVVTRNWIDRVNLHSLTPGIGIQTLGSFERSGGLTGGAGYTESRSVSMPLYMQGDYYLTVTTDATDYVPECGAAENNNAAQSTNFAVQNNLPDLVIDSVSVPSTAVVGASFNVQWTGRNVNGPIPQSASSWTDGVYLSPDTTYSSGDYYIGTAVNNSILQNGTYPNQTQVTTGNIPDGPYYVLVYSDTGRNIYEGPSNSLPENNNFRASGLITLTTPAVDLQVGSVTVAAPYHSGTFRNFSWTVTNVGSTQTLATNWSDHVILSRDSVLDPSDITLGYASRGTALAGGASYTQNANFFVPVGLTGDYSVFVITDRYNSVVESNNTNNTSAPLTINLTLPPPADLNITNITPPATISLGGNATFSWTVQNTGANAINGKWRDTVYLSRDQFWDSTDTLVGIRDLDSQTTIVPAGGGTYSPSASFAIPPVEEGTYYVIVRTDSQNRIRESNESDNVRTSVGTTNVTITQLQLNTPFNTTLGNGAQQFFKYVTDPSETLLFKLNTNISSRANEVFTNFDTMVSRADYDFQSSRPGEANQENVIESTQEGDYYTMVRTDYIPESFASNFEKEPSKAEVQAGTSVPVQNITVEAKILPFSVRSVSPEEAGNAGYASMIVEGAKFQQGATLKLVNFSGTEIVPMRIRVFTSSIGAIFDLNGKPAGDYDIVVTNPNNQTAILADGFKVLSGGGASEPRVTINGPNASRGGRARYTISVSNDGLNDLFLVPILVAMPSRFAYELDMSNNVGDMRELMQSDAIPSQLPKHFEEGGIRIIPLFTPVLGSKRTVRVNIDVILPFGFSAFEVNAATFPPLTDWYKLSRPEQQELLNRKAANLQVSTEEECNAQLKTCMRNFVVGLLFSVLQEFLPSGCIGAVFGGVTSAIDTVMGVWLNGGPGDSWNKLGSVAGLFAANLGAVAVECGGQVIPWLKIVSIALTCFKGFMDWLNCVRSYYDCLPPPPETHYTSFPQSFDPNEKIGPKGYGGEGFVPVGQPLEYRINFENLSTATAPAQLLRITDSLPPPLELRTVRLKEIGFKQYRFVMPTNQSFYQSRVQLGADLGNLQADILAGVDLVNNRIFWNIQAIDPNTSEAPLDPFAGLLPPNNENHDGEGYVIFTVEAKSSYPNRTMISNSATIIFDQNEPIVTNATANLLDSVVPTSQIAPFMTATSSSPDIVLNWSGSDDTDGSGFAGYSLLASEDGGAYSAFLNTADLSTTTFAGRWGKSYRFYSSGRDNAGNVEMPPAQPDATITVLGGDTEGDVYPRPNGSDGSVNGDDLTQIRRFIARLDAGMQYNEFQRIDTAPKASGGDGTFSVADVMQTRRFAAGTDTRAEAAGPNEVVPLAPKLIGGKSNGLLPREVRPITIIRRGNQVDVGILMENQGDETGLAFGLNFDNAVLSNPTFNLRPVAAGSTLTVNTAQVAQGKIGIMLDKAPNQPFPAGSNVLMTITFDIAMGSPATTQITIGDDPLIKEVVNGTADSLITTFSPGTIVLLGPTASNVSVSGRVLASNGTPIKNARLILAGTTNGRKVSMTNAFGYFRFDDIASGQTYTIDVSARGYVFVPRIISVTDEITEMEIFPSPE